MWVSPWMGGINHSKIYGLLLCYPHLVKDHGHMYIIKVTCTSHRKEMITHGSDSIFSHCAFCFTSSSPGPGPLRREHEKEPPAGCTARCRYYLGARDRSRPLGKVGHNFFYGPQFSVIREIWGDFPVNRFVNILNQPV